MPLRAFFDSDGALVISLATLFYVLMPLRAFFDSDVAQGLCLSEDQWSVLMPLRAFFDSDGPGGRQTTETTAAS